MEIETRLGKFVLEPITHGQYNDTIRQALVLKNVKGEDGVVTREAIVDQVTRLELMSFYSIKESPVPMKTYEDYKKLPHDVGEVLDSAADKLNSLSDGHK